MFGRVRQRQPEKHLSSATLRRMDFPGAARLPKNRTRVQLGGVRCTGRSKTRTQWRCHANNCIVLVWSNRELLHPQTQECLPVPIPAPRIGGTAAAYWLRTPTLLQVSAALHIQQLAGCDLSVNRTLTTLPFVVACHSSFYLPPNILILLAAAVSSPPTRESGCARPRDRLRSSLR